MIYLLVHYARWTLLTLSGFVASTFIAWQLFYATNYGYALGYELLDLDSTIQTFAPQNRHKNGFEITDKSEHCRLFKQIAYAVHHNGRGLKEIVYHAPTGQPIDRLLTHAEITHLRDVSRIIEILYWSGLTSLFLSLLLAASNYQTKRPPPPLKRLFLTITILFTSSGILVIWLGPKQVFYQLHQWVFPAGHQWFFYYPDSLMATIMRAPDLFGFIAIAIFSLSLFVFFTLFLIYYAIIKKKNSNLLA